MLTSSASVWNLAVATAPPVVTIDSVSRPSTGSTGSSVVTWHADKPGTFSVRLGGTSCTTGTALASGSYSPAPATKATSIAASSLAIGANTIRVCVTDATLNTGSATTTITKDTTAPTVSSINLAGPSPTNAPSVSWTVTFSEAVTGVSASNFTLLRVGTSGSPAITGVTGSGSTWTVTASTGSGDWALEVNLTTKTGIADAAGNPLANTLLGKIYQIDHVVPTISLTRPAAAAMYTLGQSVSASFACADELLGTGIATCVGSKANGAAIDTSTIGSKSFTVTALDRAGNSTTKTVTYSVIYPFSGFFGPVSNPPTVNSVKAGTSVGLFFALGGNRGLAILAGSPTSQVINCTSHAPSGATTAATGSLTYSTATSRYTFAWATSTAWANTCRQFTVALTDGTTHTAFFKFTK